MVSPFGYKLVLCAEQLYFLSSRLSTWSELHTLRAFIPWKNVHSDEGLSFIEDGLETGFPSNLSFSTTLSPSHDSVGIAGSKHPHHENSGVPSSLELREVNSYKAIDILLFHDLIILAPSFTHPEVLRAYKGKILVQKINSSNVQC